MSLGGVESLACHPRTTTHSEMSEEELDRAGITDGLVRIVPSHGAVLDGDAPGALKAIAARL